MNYRVRSRGNDLGVFTLEELRGRRQSGEFFGDEYVQAAGMNDWQPLDLVLSQGYIVPPPLPKWQAPATGPNPFLVWSAIILGAIFFVVIIVAFVHGARQGYLIAIQQSQGRNFSIPKPEAVAAASEPVVWNANTLTEADAQRRARDFRIRQWIDGYEKRGERNPECDSEIITFLQTWIARNYGGEAATNPMSLAAESEKLAADTNCTDPLVLTVVANESPNYVDAAHRYELALSSYAGSAHLAYPNFYADVLLARYYSKTPERVAALDVAALAQLQKCFTDGSFLPSDQQEIAEIFANSWGHDFFQRNARAVCKIADDARPDFHWLALVLNGENEISEAWKARGDGWASEVGQQGWQGFNTRLASARSDLTEAWNLETNYPLAPCAMIQVSLGDSGITEMRKWFDRTTVAQIDYPGAWSNMRWGLRPRWYGNEEAMLDFGKTALATGRFDTDVPRKFYDSVFDMGEEMSLPPGHYIFGRRDIWPEFQEMYNGYISAPSQARYRAGWRTSYAIVAYYAGKYDVSLSQLEALDWQPRRGILAEWDLDPMLWTLEIAARTGPLGDKISSAETLAKNGETDAALSEYKRLNSGFIADPRTSEFIQRRLITLESGVKPPVPGQDQFRPTSMSPMTN